MTEKIYLRGFKSGDQVVCPLPSSCILFFLQYCQTCKFEVVFITDQDLSTACSKFPLLALKSISMTFLSWNDAPAVVRNVCLPSIFQAEVSLVRAGLCVVLRHVIKTADAETPSKKLIDLLGFRQGSLRMCSEVSGWTKLCEVELSDSITLLIQSLKDLRQQKPACPGTKLALPVDIVKLESHFGKKCVVHNDDKKKRAELKRLKELFLHPCNVGSSEAGHKASYDKSQGEADQTEVSKGNDLNKEPEAHIEKISISASHFEVEHIVRLPHGMKRVRVVKKLDKIKDNIGYDITELIPAFHSLKVESEKWESDTSDAYLGQVIALPGLAKMVEQLTYLDVEFVHTYSEGAEMTLADLILFVYVYLFLEQLDFSCCAVADHIPNILQWAEHMVSLPSIFFTGQSLGWNLLGLAEGLRMQSDHDTNLISERTNVSFEQPKEPDCEDEDEMELSRCARMKHKAIKPEVFQAFKKLEEAEIKPCLGQHPRGQDVTVDWDSLPSGVHPKEGDVPEKRTRRKCQQLENLATAVQAVARPGDAIVDFCSGGGHLGIVLAYLLPHCQIYLVENKEESLLKVCSRLESLELTNVTLYQCNISYFTGKFGVGVCLHACGSATDMVQELCVNAGAAFVICPCCYGSIHKTHLLSYPRSKQFQGSRITYKDFLTLGHAADQTEFNIALEGQGRECMNMVDSDRAAYAKELGYQVTLCSLQPLSCTPKNNLLVGIPS